MLSKTIYLTNSTVQYKYILFVLHVHVITSKHKIADNALYKLKYFLLKDYDTRKMFLVILLIVITILSLFYVNNLVT
ncbi:hypothetical protein ECANGB1_502 [Enterospora canceri]|uniref:Uncharacterized protein n=1 Tax=Enterospora canceri TaxID=1081671 RepID=A0A1Y1S5I4_9MICR|nr:hypothetical protein ECANGB1_502 [Enterospora canceri]